jgi:hypothetical protein
LLQAQTCLASSCLWIVQAFDDHIATLMCIAGGSVAFQGWQGAFSGKKTVSLVTQKVNNGIPNFSIVLTGSQVSNVQPHDFT